LKLSSVNNRTYQLLANILPINATNKNIKWLSNNNLIASVSNNGLITANKIGYALIGAFATDGSSKYSLCYIKVMM